MRVHLTVLLAVCTATARSTGCDTAWEFEPITQSVVGPSAPVPAVAATPARGSAVSQFCAGYRAGTVQGWKDLRGAASNPDGHVPQDLLDACPTPTCGRESYDDGFAAGRADGEAWARGYP